MAHATSPDASPDMLLVVWCALRMGSERYTEASRPADPCRVAEVTLAAAVRAEADAVYIEPMPMNDEAYVITLERGNAVISTTPLETSLGTAVIARFAFLAGLDLAASQPTSAVLPVRSGTRDAEVLITVRPGTNLRADVMVLARDRNRGGAITTIGPDPGDLIGHYKVIEFLGEGGMGTVFRVEHAALGRPYALKVLRRKSSSATRLRARSSSARRAPHHACVTRTSSTCSTSATCPTAARTS